MQELQIDPVEVSCKGGYFHYECRIVNVVFMDLYTVYMPLSCVVQLSMMTDVP